MPINLIITEAGRAALLNAQQTGTDAVTITQAGLSATAITPTPGLTALPGELRRISTVGGTGTASDVIHVSMLDDSAAAYSLRSFALYLNDGTLFAIYGQADPILIKTAESAALIAVDCVFADVNAASLVFGATNFTDPDATTTRKGLIEIATNAEAQGGTDPARAITPAALAAALLPLLLARDGSGSGLDADLLDGQHGSWYADIIARLGYTPLNKAGDVMTGSLGFTLPNFYVVGYGDRATINFDAYDWLSFDRALNRLLVGIGGAEALLWHANNDGAGSGLDADLLDGQDSSFYTNIIARLGYTPVNRAGDTMTGALSLPGDPTAAAHAARKAYVDGLTAAASMLSRLITVDGSGSGLDADLLDGRHGSDFALAGDFGFPAVGVFKLPGGFCIQWGSDSHADNSGVKSVAWRARMNPLMAIASNAAGGPPSAFHGTGNYTADGMLVYSARSSGIAAGAGTSFTWIAIGTLL